MARPVADSRLRKPELRPCCRAAANQGAAVEGSRGASLAAVSLTRFASLGQQGREMGPVNLCSSMFSAVAVLQLAPARLAPRLSLVKVQLQHLHPLRGQLSALAVGPATGPDQPAPCAEAVMSSSATATPCPQTRPRTSQAVKNRNIQARLSSQHMRRLSLSPGNGTNAERSHTRRIRT